MESWATGRGETGWPAGSGRPGFSQQLPNSSFCGIKLSPHMESYFLISGLILAAAGAVTDLKSGRIPNWLTYAGLIGGLAARGWLEGWMGIRLGLEGALLGGGVFFMFFLARGMGAGDVKLMAAVGCLAGEKQTATVILATAIAGGLMAIGYMVFYKQVGSTLRNVSKLVHFRVKSGSRPHPEINLQNSGSIRLPYAVAIAAGALYAVGVLFLRR